MVRNHIYVVSNRTRRRPVGSQKIVKPHICGQRPHMCGIQTHINNCFQTQNTEADAGRAIDALFGAIASELSSGGEVSIAGFGKFETRTRNARTGRNPQTGAEISIPARRVAAFKAAKALKDQVG